MERMIRNRKAFYEKQNDVHHGNKNKDLLQNHKQPSKPFTIITNEKYTQEKQRNPTESFCQLYNKEILQQTKLEEPKSLFLANHQIDASLRARMIDWMIEVTTSYKFSYKTYFDCVHLMDYYFQKQTNCLPVEKLHIIGVSAMIIASKINQIHPLKIKTVYQKIAHRKLPVNDMVLTEAKIMQKLNYQVNSFTFFDVVCLKLTTMYYKRQNMVLADILNSAQTQPFENEQQFDRVLSVCCYLSRFVLFDYPFYCQNSTLLLAQSTIILALDICGIKICQMQLENSKYDIQTCKLQHLNIIRTFKQNFKNLNNIFKFTDSNVVKLVQKFLN